MEIKLNPQQICLINNPTTKQELVQNLVTNICNGTALNKEEVYKAIIKREQGISTTLESGLSIPHARLEGLNSFKAVLAVIPQGVQDDYGKNIKVKGFYDSGNSAEKNGLPVCFVRPDICYDLWGESTQEKIEKVAMI